VRWLIQRHGPGAEEKNFGTADLGVSVNVVIFSALYIFNSAADAASHAQKPLTISAVRTAMLSINQFHFASILPPVISYPLTRLTRWLRIC
jgi:hypothetical protein